MSLVSPSAALDLQTLSETGAAPRTRLADYAAAQAIVSKLIEADKARNNIRAKLRGQVDGNAPFSASQLRNLGQGYRTNVNFREAEAFTAMATGAFYDIFSESSTYATVTVDEDGGEEFGEIITEEFDRLQKDESGFDFNVQLSQREMVLIGVGPLVWEDDVDWRTAPIEAGNLLLPDRSKAHIDMWELAVIRCSYSVGKLFNYIANENAASSMGWDVSAVRSAIMKAMPEAVRDGEDWEYHQQRIRSNDIYYSTVCDEVQCAHVYVKEFDDKITHAIILENSGEKFLFRKRGRFADWKHVLCPFYFDRGDGFHHGVKGAGVKMTAIMELKNRLKCSIIDAAFTFTQTMMQAVTPKDAQEMAVAPMGPYVVIPPGVNIIQRTIATQLDAPMGADRELEQVLQSNLAQYRQTMEKQGNPRTAEEVRIIAGQQAALGKTQIARYYEQLDEYFSEKYRRATNPKLTSSDPGGKEALEFQDRCRKRGVTAAVLKKARVKATRVAGQGSQAMRQGVLSEILSVLQLLPESGRIMVIRDWIASRVGQSKVERYAPMDKPARSVQDQIALAQIENGVMKAGQAVVRTGSQNDSVHAGVHLSAMAQAIQSGVPPDQILAFLDLAGPHAAEHAQNVGIESEKKVFLSQLEEIGKAADDLKSQLAKAQQEQQQQALEMQAAQEQAAAISGGGDPETMIAQAKAAQEMKIKEAKAAQALKIKQEAAAQKLALKDAASANKVLEIQE